MMFFLLSLAAGFSDDDIVAEGPDFRNHLAMNGLTTWTAVSTMGWMQTIT